jgi:hypothetical protein
MERGNSLNPQHALRGIEASGIGLQGPVDLTRSTEVASQPIVARSGEHPTGLHPALSGDLWMVDHNGKTMLRCRCLAVSATRMRLCVPAGYGVAVGQRYELSTRGAGEPPFSVLRAVGKFGVTVVQTQDMTDGDADRIEVGVAVDQIEPTPMCSLPRASA